MTQSFFDNYTEVSSLFVFIKILQCVLHAQDPKSKNILKRSSERSISIGYFLMCTSILLIEFLAQMGDFFLLFH